MNILWVKAGGLVPPDTGGKIRSYNILKHLARRHEVTFFTFYREHRGDAHAELDPRLKRVICVPLQLPAPHTLSEATLYVRNFLSSQPYAIAKFCQPHVAMRLRNLVRDEPFDVLICDFVNAGGVIPWEAPCRKILFTHNVEATIWRRHYQNARNPLWKAVSWREYYAMNQVEQTYLKSADHVIAVSATDRDDFTRVIDPSRITVIPTGVDIDFFQPDPSAGKGNVIVFTGSMDWIPNEDGILHFLERVFPRIQQQIPEAQLWVVGRFPSRRLRALADQKKGIRVTGRVEDIRPYVRGAAAFVVPLRIGGGTRLKIFEAMAMGKAVVSTAIGAEGLPVQHRKNILLADQPRDFADNVVALLRDPSYREKLGRAARQLVEEGYSWESVAAEFEKVLAKAGDARFESPVECGAP